MIGIPANSRSVWMGGTSRRRAAIRSFCFCPSPWLSISPLCHSRFILCPLTETSLDTLSRSEIEMNRRNERDHVQTNDRHTLPCCFFCRVDKLRLYEGEHITVTSVD